MHYMNNFVSNVRGFYNGINSTANSGAIDVIVIEQPDGSFNSTPLRIKFGMLGVIKPQHQLIDVRVNNIPVKLNLRLREYGEAYLSDGEVQSDPENVKLTRSMSTGTLDLMLSKDSEKSPEILRRHSSSESNIIPDTSSFVDQNSQNPKNAEDSNSAVYLSEVIEDAEKCSYYLGPIEQELIPEETNDQDWFFPGIKMSMCGDLETEDESLALARFNECLVSYEDFLKSPKSTLNNKNLVFLSEGRFHTWHSIAPFLVSIGIFGKRIPQEIMDSLNCYPPKSRRSRAMNFIFGTNRNNYSYSSLNKTLSPSPMRLTVNAGSSSDLTNSDSEGHYVEETPRRRPFSGPSLSSQQIRDMNLSPGCNLAEFSVTTSYQGTATVSCRIFLWSYSDKLVISDIDGTITKTDVLGQVLPLVGMIWCHNNVIQLYRAINNNGYRLIYLSSRSIAQAALTTQFILNLRQDNVSLPHGPIMLSPFGLIQAFNKEIILKCPQEFKISCLQEIVSLFPSGIPSPIVGGFGNRDSDEATYRALGLASTRIYIIDHKSKVVIPNIVRLSTSYITVKEHVNAYFPFHGGHEARHGMEDFTASNYWRLPFYTIE